MIDPRFPQWTSMISIGVEAIDTQHAAIMHQFGATARALDRHDTQSAQAEINQLRTLIVTHFRFEERLFRASAYPHVETHRVEHQVILHLVESINDSLSFTPDTATILLSLRHLGQVIAEHLMVMDTGYRPFLSRSPDQGN